MNILNWDEIRLLCTLTDFYKPFCPDRFQTRKFLQRPPIFIEGDQLLRFLITRDKKIQVILTRGIYIKQDLSIFLYFI